MVIAGASYVVFQLRIVYRAFRQLLWSLSYQHTRTDTRSSTPLLRRKVVLRTLYRVHA